MPKAPLVGIALSLTLAGCGRISWMSSECKAAAHAQAEAEKAYMEAVAIHGHERTKGFDDPTLSTRVDLRLATEAVRRECQP